MIRRVFIATVSMALGASVVAVPHAATAQADCATLGCWSAPFSESGLFDDAPPATPEEAGELPTAVSAAVMPSGRVVYWDGLAGLEDSNVHLGIDAGRTGKTPARSRVLDLGAPGDAAYGSAPIWLTPAEATGGSPHNLFCSDQRLLADGRLVVAGGMDYETSEDLPLEAVDPDYEFAPDGGAEVYGSKHTRLFTEAAGGDTGWAWDGDAQTAVGGDDMHKARWYPSLVTLADGRLLVLSGVSRLVRNTTLYDERASGPLPVNVVETETFTPDAAGGSWELNPESANMSLPLYVRIHLLPNGEVMYSGTGQMWTPLGESVDQASWNVLRTFDPGAQIWRAVGMGALGGRNGAFSVMLPLKPPFDSAQILVAGGTLGMTPGTYAATPFSELLTVADDGSGEWRATSELTGELNNARWYSSGVLLPTGQVMAFNGGELDDVILPGSAPSVRQAELFDPETNTWTPLAHGSRDRVYHNTAILLPDGSVLVGGHSPVNWAYAGRGTNATHDTGLTGANFRDPSFEIYKPPYLFAGDRPVIKTAPHSAIIGGTIGVTVAPGSPGIEKVVLMRLPAQTHTVDADMRAIELDPIGASGSGPGFLIEGANLTIKTPDNPAVLPPGYYYIFAISADGVPSVAKIIAMS